MINHPNRGWRARARLAFAAWWVEQLWVKQFRAPPYHETLAEAAYEAGFKAGRRDVQTRTPRA